MHNARYSTRPNTATQSMGKDTAVRKRLGGYLLDAGLLTQGQIDVALNDQKMTGMRFGEILAARGWVKQQTIEYLMQKVILPERDLPHTTTSSQETHVSQPRSAIAHAATPAPGKAETDHDDTAIRRKAPPISKPLPSFGSGADDGVSWVG